MSSELNTSMSLSNPHPTGLTSHQKLGLAIIAMGILGLVIGFLNVLDGAELNGTVGCITLGTFIVGGIYYSWFTWGQGPAGIKHNGIFHNPLTNRGIWGNHFHFILLCALLGVRLFHQYRPIRRHGSLS